MNTFDLPVTFLPDKSTEISTYLNDLFAYGSRPYDQLKYEVQREFRANGSPEVTAIKFETARFDAASGKGNFRIRIDINYTFACEDVQTEKTGQASDWTFSVDANHSVIHFYGSPYIDARSTADEF